MTASGTVPRARRVLGALPPPRAPRADRRLARVWTQDEPGGVPLDHDVASLADVIRSKEAAGRDKDHLVLPVLRRILAENER